MAVTLTEKSRTTNVQASCTIGDYNYDVNYNFDATKALVSVNISISLSVSNTSIGNFYMQSDGRKNLNISDDKDMIEQSTNVNSILDIIKSGL